LDIVNQPYNCPINRPPSESLKGGSENAFITRYVCLVFTLLYIHNFTPSHLLPYSLCWGFKPLDSTPNIWHPPCFKLEKSPLRCHQKELASASRNRERKLPQHHPPKPYHILTKAKRLMPSSKLRKSSCNTQSTSQTPPAERRQVQAKMMEAACPNAAQGKGVSGRH
jgi:hypothetical protein